MPARRWTVVLALLLAGMMAGGVADPAVPVPFEEAPFCPEAVAIEVLGIRAAHGAEHVDPALEPLADQLALTRFSSFRLLDTASAHVADEQIETFRFGLQTMRVQLLDHDQTGARLRVRLYAEGGAKQLDTTVRLHRNRSFILAGPKVGADVLVFPVTARW